MKITLIASILMDYVDGSLIPISEDRLKSCPPYGVYSLATILRNNGHHVVVADLIAQNSLRLDKYEQDLKEFNCQCKLL